MSLSRDENNQSLKPPPSNTIHWACFLDSDTWPVIMGTPTQTGCVTTPRVEDQRTQVKKTCFNILQVLMYQVYAGTWQFIQKTHETCPIKLYKHPSSHKHGGDCFVWN